MFNRDKKKKRDIYVCTDNDVYIKVTKKDVFFAELLNILVIFLIISLCLILFFRYCERKNLYHINDFLKVMNIMQLYDTEYIGTYDNDYAENVVFDGAIGGLIEYTDDKYGFYVSPLERNTTGDRIKTGNYYGMGITMTYTQDDNVLEIKEISKNSPAGRTNLKSGDIITKIDGEPVDRNIYLDMLTKINERTVESIDLEVNNSYTVTVELGEVIGDKLEYEIKDDVGYIKIYTFVDETSPLFERAIDAMSEKQVKKLVFDLRKDGGGDAAVVVKMLDYILDSGMIVDFQYKNGTEIKYDADEECHLTNDVEIAIIVDGSTASASELFVMTLQDLRNAKVIGQTTFGKSTILGVYSFKDGSVFSMSVGTYYPASGRNIEGVGITPDVLLTDTEIEKEWTDILIFES